MNFDKSILIEFCNSGNVLIAAVVNDGGTTYATVKYNNVYKRDNKPEIRINLIHDNSSSPIKFDYLLSELFLINIPYCGFDRECCELMTAGMLLDAKTWQSCMDLQSELF